MAHEVPQLPPPTLVRPARVAQLFDTDRTNIGSHSRRLHHLILPDGSMRFSWGYALAARASAPPGTPTSSQKMRESVEAFAVTSQAQDLIIGAEHGLASAWRKDVVPDKPQTSFISALLDATPKSMENWKIDDVPQVRTLESGMQYIARTALITMLQWGRPQDIDTEVIPPQLSIISPRAALDRIPDGPH